MTVPPATPRPGSTPPWSPPAPTPEPPGYPASAYLPPGPAGYPAPGYAPPGYPWAGPPPNPGPSGKKLLIAAALLLTTAVIAGAVAAWLLIGVFRAQPSGGSQFASAKPMSVALEAGQTQVIYARSADPSLRVTCSGQGAADDTDVVTIEPIDGDITINDWRAGFTLTAHEAGIYTFTCKGPPGTTFGIGGPAPVGRIATSVVLILLTGATALAGLVTGIIGLARRRRSAC